jgi:deoxyribodipyrimidine photolyase-related protein
VELAQFFEGKKTFVMENFYRMPEKNTMLEGNNPVTGKWNYDKENRKSYLKS